MSLTSVFLDTNIFLHYLMFDQIDWLTVLSANQVNILIPPITIRELNKNKELHPKSRIRNRAGKVISELFSLFESSAQSAISKNVEVLLEDRDSLIDFGTHQLNSAIQDDHLIASIIMHRMENPESEIILVTSDAGLMLLGKARRHGIRTFKLPDNFKLPSELDPSEKRARQLEQEINRYKNRMPNLSLEFEDKQQYCKFEFISPRQPAGEVLAHKLEEVKKRHPKMTHVSKQKGNHTPSISAALEAFSASLVDPYGNGITSEDIDEYNQKLDSFYKECMIYFRQGLLIQEKVRRAITLNLLFRNIGTAPAKDIDILMKFPLGISVYTQELLPKPPPKPNPPSKPKPGIERIGMMSPYYSPILETLPFNDIASPFNQPNVSLAFIKKANGHDVNIHIQNLKHQTIEAIESLYIIFNSFESTKSFKIDYEIICADLPDKESGKLHIIIEHGENQ